jgi:hypothetical protein
MDAEHPERERFAASARAAASPGEACPRRWGTTGSPLRSISTEVRANRASSGSIRGARTLPRSRMRTAAKTTTARARAARVSVLSCTCTPLS